MDGRGGTEEREKKRHINSNSVELPFLGSCVLISDTFGLLHPNSNGPEPLRNRISLCSLLTVRVSDLHSSCGLRDDHSRIGRRQQDTEEFPALNNGIVNDGDLYSACGFSSIEGDFETVQWFIVSAYVVLKNSSIFVAFLLGIPQQPHPKPCNTYFFTK